MESVFKGDLVYLDDEGKPIDAESGEELKTINYGDIIVAAKEMIGIDEDE